MLPSLSATQRWFFGQLQPGARRARGLVRSSKELSAAARIDIYASMYIARLIEALAAEFPRLQAALGEDRFAALATRYFKQHPSRHATIQHVGLELPRFLAHHRLRGFPFAKDLAKLDRVASAVYVSEGIDDRALLTVDGLRAIAPAEWPGLTFQVTPTLQLVKLGWYFRPDEPPSPKSTTLRLWRRDLDVFEAEVSTREARALSVARAGRPFADICLAAGTAERAATFLATWVEEGLLLSRSSPDPGRSRHRGLKTAR